MQFRGDGTIAGLVARMDGQAKVGTSGVLCDRVMYMHCPAQDTVGTGTGMYACPSSRL